MSHLLHLAAYEPDFAANLGALARIGVCFGVPLHVIEPCGFPFSLKLLRKRGLDYTDDVDLHHHDDWAAFEAAPMGRRVLMTTKGAADLWDFSFQPGDCLVLGRESAGVPDSVHQAADAHVKIPMPGGARSLNVAVAGGIAVAEALRQLR
ncbi:TrmH family RNA methyltransferase [Litoreibacter roseus]|uniref:tRNA (cytidine(34)-2'-O)-methyltransferase n=1 Tax=Litoreibacter roseus TaxID=2601869 RepID=A0A6N6JDR1_9RHOB|nr:TrmH family RNA methyltransferase [Litoreibacter roseus]GFE64346.1 tRNA (cytidine(34)-2'-O)-methyltransferase [Litoreibacter roseus]